LAGAASPAAVRYRAEEGHHRPRGGERVRTPASATARTSTTSTCSPSPTFAGTNPKLWNAWKASLFEEFFERTKRALRRGLESPLGEAELIAETQGKARGTRRDGVCTSEINRVWKKDLTGAYFLRHTAEEIAWRYT
jgi:hypothetical protein